MTRPDDMAQRTEALDPRRSFIVEAPAGSGKTELLIQRFLKLLARVERPEQIIAITFTRKAAAEMRQRVIDSLRAAAAEDPDVPEHRRGTLLLAAEVLAHAARSGWSLVDQPRRLRIMTIDALNASLARQMPILANGTVSLGVTDDTSGLYQLAAEMTTQSLADSGPLGSALRSLLAATDNSLVELERQLASTLPQRDRWLREFAKASDESLAGRIESGLRQLQAERIADIRRLVDADDEQRLFAILAQRTDAETVDPTAKAQWPIAARLLLTQAGDWRKRFTRNEGFPADNKPLKADLNAVLENLQATDGLLGALAALGAVPDPATGRDQHALLEALAVVLPRLLAELRILFERSGSVDHTEVAIAALQALGAVDQPSELLLALDRRIEHILVDEFQDTSHLQWRLLEQLTAGWQPGDGRSLFLVGDPMQSIYRFRDADVSLFVKAREQGLGGVDLTPVSLTRNHRSAREIVDWVNAAFAGIFPPGERPDHGVTQFRAAVSARDADAAADVELHWLSDTGYAAEVARVTRIAEKALAENPAQSIGILVRSRSHLAGMRAALDAAGLPAEAIEIDSLTDTQLGQDLIGLTSALLHPGDRLAWLGVLRSPWCGLDWADLLALVEADTDSTIWERIHDPNCRAGLSPAGQQRAEWLGNRLAKAIALRQADSLGGWIRNCWLAIDGPATLADDSELDQAERFFMGLESLAKNGDVDDPAALQTFFSKADASAEVPSESGIEIMTMHRAKGLEFDTVILPGLGRTTRGSSFKLLLSNTFLLSDDRQVSLIAVAGRKPDPLVDYLQAVERQRDTAERGRLLYVAATRAKQRLHLIGSVDRDSELPKAGSLLASLWPALVDSQTIAPVEHDAVASGVGFTDIPIRCLEFSSDLRAVEPEAPESMDDTAGRPDFEWVRPASVQVGTLIHRELQRLADQAARSRQPIAPDIDTGRYRRELALLGVESDDLSSGARRVADALNNVWNDQTGRWILKPWPEAWSELRLTVRDGNRLKHFQLDRSFVDGDGRRWIIDFKTGQHLGSNITDFLDSEVERYRPQLERYAMAVAQFDSRPIRVGLYFPLMTALRDWEPAVRGG